MRPLGERLRPSRTVVSQHPHDLEPVPPIVEFDPSRFKLAADTTVVGALGGWPDLRLCCWSIWVSSP
ncbi:hypothetical protein [Kitasatospora sp. NPDC002040]|uniref:hypothetical protein n=1 Tax=Kitasatospora sp. NPDC002040 TaxID=3154661 RepID=UPI00333382A7